MPIPRVLITDGAMKHTLAAVRSLGKRGIHVTVVDESYLAESFYSRYCHTRRLTPRRITPEQYVKYLRLVLLKEHYDVLLPISYYSCYNVAKYRHYLENLVNFALPDFTSMEIAANKDRTMDYARKLGLNVPITVPLEVEDDLHKAEEVIGFPMVVKGSTEGGSVRYAHNSQDLKSAFQHLCHDHPIAQQYIRGPGYGYYAAYNNGKCIANFMHKRIREYPSSGGPSSAARSFYSNELMTEGRRLLDSLKWHGVAMVEFKQSLSDGKFYLMEINPKFWGSLDLSIYAGMDFPFIAFSIANGNASSVIQKRYRSNAFFRWPFPGEFLHALETLQFGSFFTNFIRGKYADDIRITDPAPLLLQIISTIRKVRKRKSDL